MKATAHPNPFEWRGYLSHVYPAPPPDKHMAAIEWKKLPELFAALAERGDTMPALAARFQIALALRPNEARRARFDMLDVGAGTITLPVTKNGKPFVGPLSPAAISVVERCQALRLSDYLFPGVSGNKPIHECAIVELIQSFHPGASAHGTARSGFSDWAYENDVAPDSVIEASLNHATPGGATVRAYKRGSQLDLRVKLMSRYSDFLTGASNIIAFPLATAAAE